MLSPNWHVTLRLIVFEIVAFLEQKTVRHIRDTALPSCKTSRQSRLHRRWDSLSVPEQKNKTTVNLIPSHTLYGMQVISHIQGYGYGWLSYSKLFQQYSRACYYVGKGPFIATQLNSTQLNSTELNSTAWTTVDSVCRSWRHKQKHDWLDCTLFNWVNWVQLCRYKHPLTRKTLQLWQHAPSLRDLWIFAHNIRIIYCQWDSLYHSIPCHRNNKCIGDDTKAVARRSPDCMRKTTNTFCGTRVSVALPKFCEKLLASAKFHWNRPTTCELWPKNDF